MLGDEILVLVVALQPKKQQQWLGNWSGIHGVHWWNYGKPSPYWKWYFNRHFLEFQLVASSIKDWTLTAVVPWCLIPRTKGMWHIIAWGILHSPVPIAPFSKIPQSGLFCLIRSHIINCLSLQLRSKKNHRRKFRGQLSPKLNFSHHCLLAQKWSHVFYIFISWHRFQWIVQ